jgi:hypothetical protein
MAELPKTMLVIAVSANLDPPPPLVHDQRFSRGSHESPGFEKHAWTVWFNDGLWSTESTPT